MKKSLLIFPLLIYSASVFIFSSSMFLVGGSDMLELVFTVPIYGKIVSVLGLLILGCLMLVLNKRSTLWIGMFFLFFFFSILSSQNLVYSGKKNKVIYSINGFVIKEINFNPTDEVRPKISSETPGLTKISYGNVSLTYVSLFFPFNLDVSEMVDI